MKIRKYRKGDSVQCANLIYSVFKEFNGNDYFEKNGVQKVLDSLDVNKLSEEEVFDIFKRAKIVYVALDNERIVGVIRGNKDKVSSFAIEGKYHGKGIGKKLLQKFEFQAKKSGSEFIKLKSSLFAVKFYENCDYKKTTGTRNFLGLKIINMKKSLL